MVGSRVGIGLLWEGEIEEVGVTEVVEAETSPIGLADILGAFWRRRGTDGGRSLAIILCVLNGLGLEYALVPAYSVTVF